MMQNGQALYVKFIRFANGLNTGKEREESKITPRFLDN